MAYTITDGKVKGIPFLPARSSGGEIKPELIVLHDTAGALTKGSSVAWFRDSNCTTSAHFVVERDGSVTQMVRCDRKAFHAGKSSWNGRTYCNSFAIGIEIVNPGKMDEHGVTYFGKATSEPLTRMATKAHGDGWWLPYTAPQIQAVKQLCRAIMATYPDCNEITTHWAISPGRKIDPCPLFPVDEVRAYALGEGEEAEVADVPPAPVLPAPEKKPILPTIVESKSLWTIMTAFFAKVAAGLTAMLGLLPEVQTEAARSIDPLASLGGWLGQNLEWLTTGIVLVAFVIVFLRHLDDKRRMT